MSDPTTAATEAGSAPVALTRSGLRHLLIRRRNERVAASRDDRWPLHLTMSWATRSELLIDSDPDEQRTVDFEGNLFIGIPIVLHPDLELGVVEVTWPNPLPASGDPRA